MSDNSGTVECKKKSFSKKKVVMIVVGAFLALFLIAAIVFVCVLTDQPKIFIMSMSARHSASEFIKNKYGEKLYVEKTEPYYSTGSLFSQLAGTIVYSEDGYIVVVTDGGCSDDKQYELIKSDFCDKYLIGSALGLPVNYEAYLFEPIEGHFCTEELYNGDIASFLQAVGDDVRVNVDYKVTVDDMQDYKTIAENIFSDIDTDCNYCHGNMRIFDADACGEEDYESYKSSVFNRKLSCEYYSGVKSSFVETKFIEVDSFTASYSCRSGQAFSLTEKDMSDNTEAYPAYSENAQPLRIRDIAYNFNVDNNYDLFLRLDRDHYNITEKTVPLMVSDVIDYNTYYQRSGDWVGRRSYYSVDYPPYAPQSVESSPILGCDYFLDQDYLYLYIGCMKVDNLSAYLAFADIE